jgi:hypothetical protein
MIIFPGMHRDQSNLSGGFEQCTGINREIRMAWMRFKDEQQFVNMNMGNPTVNTP